MVEVFKTNVRCGVDADNLLSMLQSLWPHCRFNFDLDDCDNILRIKGENFCPAKTAALFEEHGFECEVLEG